MTDSGGAADVYANVAELFDLVYRDRTQDVSFYADRVTQSVGTGRASRVLEIGAGTGRVSLPIAENNPEIRFTAIDIDDDELAILRRKISDRRLLNVDIVNVDVREYHSDDRFDIVIAPFRVLQHCLSVEDLAAVLEKARRMLKSRGKLIFDLFNPSIPLLAKPGRVTSQELVDDYGGVVRRHVDVHERHYFSQVQKVEEYYEVICGDGSTQQFSWIYETRYFFKNEVVPLLKESGLTVEAVLGGFNGEPFGQAEYPGDLIFIASSTATE